MNKIESFLKTTGYSKYAKVTGFFVVAKNTIFAPYF